MKVLLYGSKGWIGNQFLLILNENNINVLEGKARVDNEKQLLKEVEEIQPTHIVSFIGRTHGPGFSTIDYLEQPGKIVDNVRDNLFSPLLLAQLCTQKDIHYTYLGTGCIFEYDEDHPFGEEVNGFNEESLPNFFGSSYSVVKGFTDRLMHGYEESVLNLRIRMPITNINNPRNFITKITNYEKICSIPNSMTVLPELLPYVVEMMKNKTTGTVNLTNPGLISHNDILKLYKEIVDKDFTWNNFSIEEQNVILASKRSNNYLDTKKLETLFPNILNIEDAVINMLKNWKN